MCLRIIKRNGKKEFSLFVELDHFAWWSLCVCVCVCVLMCVCVSGVCEAPDLVRWKLIIHCPVQSHSQRKHRLLQKTHTHTRTHAHTRTHTHARTHTRTHTQTDRELERTVQYSTVHSRTPTQTPAH